MGPLSEVKSAIQMTAFKDATKEDGFDPRGLGRLSVMVESMRPKAALSGLFMDEPIANNLAARPIIGGDVKIP